MKRAVFRYTAIALVPILSLAYVTRADDPRSELQWTPKDALEAHGLSVFLFHNSYRAVFPDQKMSRLEIILHDQRIATNGDVRLSPAPPQWDPIPQFKERKRGSLPNELIASLSYADWGFAYRLDVRPETGAIRVSVPLDRVRAVSDVSCVSGIGAQSQLVAYGNNRADYTFIPGGMIPRVTVVQPDFPELTGRWPFLWYENEYVVDTAAAFLLAANCANAAASESVESEPGGPGAASSPGF